MEIKELIKYAIDEVVSGVLESQEKHDSNNVIICPRNITMKADMDCFVGEINTNTARFSSIKPVSVIDFDISIMIEETESSEGKGSLKVASFGLSGGLSREGVSRDISRLKFSIPLVLPSNKK